MRIRERAAWRRRGVIVASLRDGSYLVDFIPQAVPAGTPTATDPASSELAEVRRCRAEALLPVQIGERPVR